MKEGLLVASELGKYVVVVVDVVGKVLDEGGDIVEDG